MGDSTRKTNKDVISWWSGGLTSAVACRLAIEKYSNVRLVYIHIGSHHKDVLRFKTDCEKWYGKEIEVYQSTKYDSQFDVIRDTKYVNGPNGARCTFELKKEVRQKIEREFDWSNQVYGFEFGKQQINRAIRWQEQYEYTNSLFPLIEERLNKNECAGIVMQAGIKIPEMYKLGYNNNNCIGCVKGGAGYWNKIRVDFPEVFTEMAEIEREVGASCLKNEKGKLYLDELPPDAGNPTEIVLGECGIFCQVDYAHIMSPKVNDVLNGSVSIYQSLNNSLR